MCKRWSTLFFLVVAIHGVCALADPLTDRVVAAFKQGDPKLAVTVKTDDELHLRMATGSEVTVFLDRTRGQCRQQPEHCDTVIEQLVSGMAASAGSPAAMKFDPENVYPVVRPADSLRGTQAAAGGNADPTFVSRPYMSGAIILYALDTPKALRFVGMSDLEHAGLAVDSLDKLARSHVQRLIHLQLEKVKGAPGLWEGIAKDGYGTSHLFDPNFWDEVEAAAGGPVAIALPTRDWILAARLDDPQSIARLRVIAKRIVAGEPTAVISALVRRDGESWTEVP
jgi:uncharacterized protein YtpQ (UPF0354 family)